MADHDRLAVDLDGIEHWSGALTDVRTGLDQPVGFPAGRDQLGTDPASTAVQAGLAYFDQAWDVGRSVIDSYMTALSKMCDDTVARIRQLDQTLAPPPHRPRMVPYAD